MESGILPSPPDPPLLVTVAPRKLPAAKKCQWDPVEIAVEFR